MQLDIAHQALLARYLVSASSTSDALIPLLEVETFVLLLQIVLDIEFGVFFPRRPMEVASSLTPIDGNLWISGPINNLHGIPIGLCTVYHEAFEVGLGDSMAGLDVVEVVPEKHLSIIVFGLKVTASDGHDAHVCYIVNVACHGCPLGDSFDMVGHDPNMPEIPTWLHVLDKVDPTTRADLRHLENKNFVRVVTLA